MRKLITIIILGLAGCASSPEAQPAPVPEKVAASSPSSTSPSTKREGSRIASFRPAPLMPAIDARVVAVRDDVTPHLVLLSVGSDDKVEKGYHFSIYRESTFVGKVVVEKVLADSSGCRVLFVADGQSVRQGDNAATRLQ